MNIEEEFDNNIDKNFDIKKKRIALTMKGVSQNV